MSLNLKQLMEDDAGRPVSSAPVDEVLAGGRFRVRRRRIVGIAAAAAAAVLAIAIPVGLMQNDSTDEPIRRPERIEWSQLDGPWVDPRSIHLGDLTVLRPPRWDVDVLTSTRDSAVYWSANRNGSIGTLTEVRADGTVRQLGRDVVGVPFTDPTGSEVAWLATSHEIVVYDTSNGSEVARQPVGDDAVVSAVDDGIVTYTDSGQLYTWRAGEGPPVPADLPLGDNAVTDVSGELYFVAGFDRRSGSYVVDGDRQRVLTIDTLAFGEFDPSGRYLAVTRVGDRGSDVPSYALHAVDAERDTELTGLDGDIDSMSWDPSGSLIVATVEHDDGILSPDEEVTFYACDPATGACALVEGSTVSAETAAMPANFSTMLLLSYPG